MKAETVFQKMKNDCIFLNREDFSNVVEILRYSEENVFTPLFILTRGFNDSTGLINDYVMESGNIEDPFELYDQVKSNAQKDFKNKIMKKFNRSDIQHIQTVESNDVKPPEEVGKIVRLKDIKISRKYRRTIPHGNKIQRTIDFYRENGKFHNKIEIDEHGYLIDGYTQYLVAKMLDIYMVSVYNKSK